MDASEKRVLSWKRHLIATNVGWTDDFIVALKQRNLISDGVLVQIEPRDTGHSRMLRYIELLIKDGALFGSTFPATTGSASTTPTNGYARSSSAFNSFCDAIENEGGKPWLADELRIELKNERGDLIIENDIRKEAAHLIHRLYGGNRRLPEVEKRRLETLISTRNQITKEVWKRNVDTTTLRLENAVAALRSYQTEVAAAVKNLQNAVRDQRRVTTNGTSTTTTGGRSYPLADDGYRNAPLFPDIRSSSNSRRNGSGQSSTSGSFGGGLRLESASGVSISDSIYGSDPLIVGELAGRPGGGGNTSKVLRWEATAGLEKITAAVADAVDMVRWSTDAWVAEREWLRNERSRCFLVLGIKETTGEGGDGNSGTGARRLDAEVQQVLDKLNAALSLTKERAVDAEQRASLLEERLRTSRADVEDELRAKDRTISLLTASLERAEKEAELSNGEGRELKRQLQVAKTELSHYSVKSKYLEKSRRLGYYYRDGGAVDVTTPQPTPGGSNGSWTVPVVASRSPALSSEKQPAAAGIHGRNNATSLSQQRQ